MAQYRLDLLVADLPLVWYVRVFLKLLPWRLFITANDTNAARFRLALEALGPVFVKFGQVLSTRRDLLSDAYAIELSKLQDQVPPFDGATAQKIIEQELESPITVLFKTFEQTSLASASVAQVHQATLHTGQEVVVKVIRPGINRVIEEDIALLYLLAWLVSRFWSEGKRLRPLEVVHEYEQTLMDELDLRKEAANGSQLRRNFEQSDILYVPEVYWDYTRQNVLVMERIYGIPVADIQALNAQNTHMQKLAERGVEIFFTQVFRDSFFHADMHPGNIFVSREDPENPQYIAIDFGIIGSLTEQDQHYLARNILAFFKRDYRQVAQLHIDSGWVPRHTNLHAFETAIRSVCEPIFEKPLKDISFGMVLLGLFQTARRFQMEVQPQLVLLQKTLLNIEGLGRQLYPDLDLWKTAKPFLEDWMKARMSIRHNSAKVLEQLPEWFEKFPQLPHVVFDALQASRQTQEIQMQQSALQFQQLEKRKQRQRRFMLAGVSSIAAVVFMLDSSAVAQWSQLPWIGWLLLVLGWLFIWYA